MNFFVYITTNAINREYFQKKIYFFSKKEERLMQILKNQEFIN